MSRPAEPLDSRPDRAPQAAAELVALSPDVIVAPATLEAVTSDHTRRNFEVTARRSLAGLPMLLRAATVEEVRDALEALRAEVSETTGRQYVLRVKSLLSYAQRVGYTPFNAGAVIKIRSDAAHRGANLAKRILTEVQVSLLIRAAPSKRDRVLLEVIYAAEACASPRQST